MKSLKLTIAVGAALAAGAAQAAGPLFLFDAEQPYKWDTSNGPIPVYTDGGQPDVNGVPTFAFDFDGVTAFVSIDRANEITQFAFDQWNSVPTSTFEAQVAGTIEDVTGIADVTGANAAQIYNEENGYGFFVLYDTDSSILSDFFGVGPSVLGIAFPEIADEETGEILEATAVINANAIWAGDPNGDELAGVFTHEFGHTINLSHSQTNGDLFFASPFVGREAGPRECGPYPNLTTFEELETMFPFISVRQNGPGAAQSTINLTDDKVSISNLYPTADYSTSLGSISGVLRLKDGKTEYSGINVVARNVNDYYGDAVSAMTGDQTQGLVGPDGRFTINGLTPGEDYILYIDNIWAGGYPTTPQPLVAQGEYWNVAEGSDPVQDDVCDFTPITAEAGVTQSADITFNGYTKGIQYTPIVAAFLTDLSKNGRKSAGQAGQTSFVWDFKKGFSVLPPEFVSATGTEVFTRNGQQMLVQYDDNDNGIQQAAIFDFQGGRKGRVKVLGDLNGDTCGGSSSNGVNSTSAWAIDDTGSTAVGLGYKDVDGDGSCQRSFTGEIVPWLWDDKDGIRELDWSGLNFNPQFVRAQAISGDGNVVLGLAGFSRPVAWIDEGPIMDLREAFDAREAYAVNRDGTTVALQTGSEGVLLWNALTGETENIGSLQWCEDLDFIQFGRNFCDLLGPEVVQELLGPLALTPFDTSDDGSVIVGRGGSFRTGLIGGIWIEDLGWFNLRDFLYEQGVTESFDFPMDNPLSLDGNATKMMGGLAGSQFSWLVEMDQVYVCDGGESVLVGFPGGLRDAIAGGAEFGRCEFILD
jgi:hypothetical protein